ncbi:unnamed protein product [Linum trigynum]|uniref:SWIM-type domain-containing protein n=1 Tax=Linum trigynum TaxID=586398 RepID=A0AAV2CSV8_9ROSI
MLEGIRGYMMVRMRKMHRKYERLRNLICPQARSIIAEEDVKARKCLARASTNDRVEVRIGAAGFVVDLGSRDCTCGAWQLSGIPCCHAQSAMGLMRLNVEDYVHECYLVTTARKVYAHGMPCMSGPQTWPSAEGYPVYPPIQKAMPGRPKKKRRKEAAELEVRVHKNGSGQPIGREGMVMHCSKCRGTGHNARKCPNPPFVPSELVMENVQGRGTRGRGTRGRGTRGRGRGQQGGSNEGGRGQPMESQNEASKPKRAIHCGKCKQPGHNARKCPLNMGIQFPRAENAGIRSSAEAVGTQPTEIDATQGPTTQPQ